MAKYIIPELKPLYANFIRIEGFKEYLISEDFNLFCIEKNLDDIWDGANTTVHKNSHMAIIMPGYTGYATKTFEIFIVIVYQKDKSKFIIRVGEILNSFQKWKNIKINSSIFSENLLKLGYSKKEVSVFDSNVIYTPTPISTSSKSVEVSGKNMSRKIFIVHGHDNELKQHVARILEKIDFEPIILHEQPDSGQTVIEKIERYADKVQYAIILMTPDDEGKTKGMDELKTRARQNVVLEYGYFIGKYGRDRVTCLYKGIDELPSDMSGLIYTNVEDNEAWKYQMANNLKDAGYEVDMNELR